MPLVVYLGISLNTRVSTSKSEGFSSHYATRSCYGNISLDRRYLDAGGDVNSWTLVTEKSARIEDTWMLEGDVNSWALVT